MAVDCGSATDRGAEARVRRRGGSNTFVKVFATEFPSRSVNNSEGVCVAVVELLEPW